MSKTSETHREIDEEALDKAVELGTALAQTAQLALDMDIMDNEGRVMSSRICYTEEMGLQAVLVLSSVLMNRAIHHGIIKTEEDANKAGEAFGKALLDIYGFDAAKVAQSLQDQTIPEDERSNE